MPSASAARVQNLSFFFPTDGGPKKKTLPWQKTKMNFDACLHYLFIEALTCAVDVFFWIYSYLHETILNEMLAGGLRRSAAGDSLGMYR